MWVMSHISCEPPEGDPAAGVYPMSLDWLMPWSCLFGLICDPGVCICCMPIKYGSLNVHIWLVESAMLFRSGVLKVSMLEGGHLYAQLYACMNISTRAWPLQANSSRSSVMYICMLWRNVLMFKQENKAICCVWMQSYWDFWLDPMCRVHISGLQIEWHHKPDGTSHQWKSAGCIP